MKVFFSSLKEYLLIFFGTSLVGIAVYVFLNPLNIAAGGVTGLALVIAEIMPDISYSVIFAILNIILLICALIVIGKDFVKKTVFASVTLSGSIFILERLLPSDLKLIDDIYMNIIFGILISGIGMGITFYKNASTGGTDIIAKIINKYTGLEIGKSLMITDLSVVILAGVVFGTTNAMYALFCILLNMFIIDKVIVNMNQKLEVQIMTNKNDEVMNFIENKIGKDFWVQNLVEGSQSNSRLVVVTITNKKELKLIKNFLISIDKNSRIKVYKLEELYGDEICEVNWL